MGSSELYYAEIRIINPFLRDLFRESKEQGIFQGTFLDVILAPEHEGRSDHAAYLVNQRVRDHFACPSTREEILPALIKVIARDWSMENEIDPAVLDSFVKSLLDHKTEIDGAFQSVRWQSYYMIVPELCQERYRYDQDPWFEKYSRAYREMTDDEDGEFAWTFNTDDSIGW